MWLSITYFVHWTTTDNENNISSGWSDVALSELGIRQSLELKELIKEKYFDVVFCSDLKRAIQSSELMFEWVVNVIQDKRLRECNYGIYNAKPSIIVEPLQEKYIENRFPEWESYEDVKNRVYDFLNYLKTMYNWKSIAIVSHKAPQLALDVIIEWMSRQKAFSNDWRKTKNRKPWRDYIIK